MHVYSCKHIIENNGGYKKKNKIRTEEIKKEVRHV